MVNECGSTIGSFDMKQVVDRLLLANGTPRGKAYLLPIARLLMSSLFVWDGIVQLRNPTGTAQYFARVGAPSPGIAIWVSIAIHLIGGLALLVVSGPAGPRPY